MIITKIEKLQELCEKLVKEPFFAIDTEFIREKTYYPKLCLIQVATDDIRAVIDPLAEGMDLRLFYELLQNDSVQKVFHSSRQDIEIFCHLTNQVPKNIYDTQVAAMVCGFGETVSYERLAKHYCEMELDKSARVTDWSNRPLSEGQINYAISDVIYLVDIYKKLKGDIEKVGREEWIKEEMEFIHNRDTYINDPEDIWRKIKSKPREEKKRVLLKELAKWREHKAMELDKPRKQVISDNHLVNIIKNYDMGNLKAIKGTRYASEIKEILNNVTPSEIDETVFGKPLSKHLFSLLKILLKIKCDENNVASKIVASKDDMARFINGKRDLPMLSGWRHEIFGKYALQLVKGEIVLGVDDEGDVCINDK